jgi:hypothetical protein
MFILAVFEAIIAIVLMVILMSQIVIPLWRNTPVFWILRKQAPRKKLEELSSEIAVEAESQDVRQKEDELSSLLKKRQEDLERREEALRKAEKAAGRYYDPKEKK